MTVDAARNIIVRVLLPQWFCIDAHCFITAFNYNRFILWLHIKISEWLNLFVDKVYANFFDGRSVYFIDKLYYLLQLFIDYNWILIVYLCATGAHLCLLQYFPLYYTGIIAALRTRRYFNLISSVLACNGHLHFY